MCTIGVKVECSIITRDLVVKNNNEVILDSINLELTGNGVIQVIGPNGAGKTTLLKVILGLVRPHRGFVRVCGIDPFKAPHKTDKLIGYVPQEQVLPLDTPITAWEFLEYTLSFKISKRKLPKIARKDSYIEELMHEVGLSRSHWYKSLGQLSSGERQRVYIARALIGNPPILLMDEPLSAVDPRGRHEITNLIGNLSRRKMLIVTSHDPFFLIKYTRYVVALNRRVVVQGPPKRVLKKELLVEVYGEKPLSLVEYSHICDLH